MLLLDGDDVQLQDLKGPQVLIARDQFIGFPPSATRHVLVGGSASTLPRTSVRVPLSMLKYSTAIFCK